MNSIEWFANYTAAVREKILSALPDPDGCLLELGWETNMRECTLAEVDFKIEHTYKVEKFCRRIAAAEALSERDSELASLTGLYHDLGRFKQALQFGTMDDRITGSHGEMSAALFLADAPKGDLTEEEIAVISDALSCHNMYKLPETLRGRGLFFTKLLRDADKMDIFRFYSDKNEHQKFRFLRSAAEGDYSPGLVERVLAGENLNVNCIQNQKDRQLMQMSMVYDLNFAFSRKHILEQGYIAKIAGTADGTADEIMHKVCRHIEEWLEA